MAEQPHKTAVLSADTGPVAPPGAGAARPARRGRRGRGWRRRTMVLGVAMVALVVGATLVGLVWLPHDPLAVDFTSRLAPPAWQEGGSLSHLLGTDTLGRDVLSRLMYAGRWSLSVGVLAALLSAVIGVGLGLLAGLYGGVFDTIVTFGVNWFIAFPFIVLALVVIALFGPSLINVIFVLGIGGWTTFARVVRTETLSLREMDFVRASKLAGATDRRLLGRHILPNTFDSVVVLFSLQLATMILAESFLSFVGLGIQPPTPSWGSMIADSRAYLTQAWWLPTMPGIALFLASLGVNLMGDGLRDVLDPRTS